jgi:hypothetical protein
VARAVPDVAYNANPNSGVSVYDSYGNYGWMQVGGTSAGSPQWAALVAIADQGQVLAGCTTLDGVKNTLPALYSVAGTSSYASSFHDITTGSNNGYAATTGYDAVTGLGTPVALKGTTGIIPLLSGTSVVTTAPSPTPTPTPAPTPTPSPAPSPTPTPTQTPTSTATPPRTRTPLPWLYYYYYYELENLSGATFAAATTSAAATTAVRPSDRVPGSEVIVIAPSAPSELTTVAVLSPPGERHAWSTTF